MVVSVGNKSLRAVTLLRCLWRDLIGDQVAALMDKRDDEDVAVADVVEDAPGVGRISCITGLALSGASLAM